MKEKQLHEGCIEQIWRMFTERLYTGGDVPVDESGLIRLDDYEMRADVQAAVAELWETVTTDNILALSDLKGYRHEFHKLFGFEVSGIDYDADCSPDVAIESIESGVSA